jgi:general secretion pathway protein G
MKQPSPLRRRRLTSGFTLLEMVIVLGIIALLLGGAIAVVGPKILNSAKYTRVKGDFSALRAAVMSYRNIGGYYPTTQQGLKALINKPTSTPIPQMWESSFPTIPLDPWGNEYGYKYPGTKDKSEFEIISKGPDGIEGTPDDISSQAQQ